MIQMNRKNTKGKKTTKEVLEKIKCPWLEHGYIKFPNREPRSVTVSSYPNRVAMSRKKIDELLREENEEKYTEIHTHIDENFSFFGLSSLYKAFPTSRDLISFMEEEQCWRMVIAQQDYKTGKVDGYFVLRKGKSSTEFSADKVKEDARKYGVSTSPMAVPNIQKAIIALEDFVRIYDLKFRFIPSKGYLFTDLGRFARKGSETPAYHLEN